MFSETMRSATAAVRGYLRRECRNRAWTVQEKKSRVHRLGGRPVELVEAGDAINLYRRAHRIKVAVFYFGKPVVPLSPDAPAVRKKTMRLSNFVRYKAYAERLPTERMDLSEHLDSCEEWRRSVECEDGHDPRCLPLHLFATEHKELDSEYGRGRFGDAHGAGARRHDDRGLRWQLEPARFHGRDILHVAGYDLPRGFHWDVSVDGRRRMIVTAAEKWEVAEYVNISPDAHVRGRSPYATEDHGVEK